MVYIIEGNETKQLVTGGYVGSRHLGVDKEKLQEEIDNLKAEGFEVIRTPHTKNTMYQLSVWAKRIGKELQDGTLVAELTYQQFKDKLNEIPRDTDFSRLAKYHAAQKLGEEEADGVEPGDSDGEPAETKATAIAVNDNPEDDEFVGVSTSRLKEMCKSVGLPMSGKRPDLIKRYRGPHPPKVWIRRKQRNLHVPARFNVAGTALLVALYLHERKTGELDKGMKKEELYTLAESLDITKNPFSGGTTQTGPFHYDGWSAMPSLCNGDPALVVKTKGRYKLTRSCDLAGWNLAKGMHKWCHEHNTCACGEEV